MGQYVLYRSTSRFLLHRMTAQQEQAEEWDETVDVAIIGAGLGGLCAGAVLNSVYGRTVAVYETHYLPGGCAHAFDRRNTSTTNGGTTYTFDAGPTILLGCSRKANPNPLQQVLHAINQTVEWIPYDAWGMVEYPGQADKTLQWQVPLGVSSSNATNVATRATSTNTTPLPRFVEGPIQRFGGLQAVEEYQTLRTITAPLTAGAAIPAMALRAGPTAVIPLLLRHARTLFQLIQQGNAVTTGTFAPYMDGPLFHVQSPWLRAWLDALAFSLSGLPANRTAAAAMAAVLQDMHTPDATLDYPVGGMGSVVDALVRGITEKPTSRKSKVQESQSSSSSSSAVHLRTTVARIEFDSTTKSSTPTAIGVTLQNGRRIRAKQGVVVNVPVWSLRSLVQHDAIALSILEGNKDKNTAHDGVPSPPPPSSWTLSSNSEKKERGRLLLQRPPVLDTTNSLSQKPQQQPLLQRCDTAEQTGSFLHLHLALNASGLDMEALEAHYTVMDRGLYNAEDENAEPWAESNMVAVSNPCRLDDTLAPPGTIIVHAYGAGNEPMDYWKNLDRKSTAYKQLKEERCQVLWRAVESIIPDARQRVLLEMTGSPLTHARYLNRPAGTYGAATEDYLPDGSTTIRKLVLCGDGIFPGIGMPAVAINGVSAANSLVSVWEHLQCLNKL
jgi:phytoene dehydrogenase-like protein